MKLKNPIREAWLKTRCKEDRVVQFKNCSGRVFTCKRFLSCCVSLYHPNFHEPHGLACYRGHIPVTYSKVQSMECSVFKKRWLGEERVACLIMLGRRSPRLHSRLNQRCSLRWGFGRGGATPASKVSQLLLCVILSRFEHAVLNLLKSTQSTKLWYSKC